MQKIKWVQNKQPIRTARQGLTLGFAIALATAASGCASGGKALETQRGPIVMNPRSEPERIELTRDLQAKQPHQFLVDIQDFTAPITEAKVQISGTSVEVPLQKVGGTTWRGELSSEQLRSLSVSGKTLQYEAQVIARDSGGQVNSKVEPFKLGVSAPAYEPARG